MLGLTKEFTQIFNTIDLINKVLLNTIELIKQANDNKLPKSDFEYILNSIENTITNVITKFRSTTVGDINILLKVLDEISYLKPKEKKDIFAYFSGLDLVDQIDQIKQDGLEE